MPQGSSGHLPLPTPLSLPLAVVIQRQMSRSLQTPGLLCSYSANPKERDAPYITNEAWALIGLSPLAMYDRILSLAIP